jgi:hypothetical protein
MTEEKELPDTRDIWLLLLKEGGLWTVGEIASALGGGSDRTCRFLNMMVGRGYLRRHVKQTKEERKERTYRAYSVDQTCKIPLKLTIGDLQGVGVEVGA